MIPNADEPEYVISYDDLVEDVCWGLLSRTSFGRVIFCEDGEPGALPVNCAVSDHTIVFRTSDGQSRLHTRAEYGRPTDR